MIVFSVYVCVCVFNLKDLVNSWTNYPTIVKEVKIFQRKIPTCSDPLAFLNVIPTNINKS